MLYKILKKKIYDGIFLLLSMAVRNTTQSASMENVIIIYEMLQKDKTNDRMLQG